MNFDPEKATRAYEPIMMYYPEDIESSTIDLVADVLHYAAQHGINPEDVIRQAIMHYTEESNHKQELS